jgi:DNA-binding CsgD family transcriptional regulator
MTQLSPDLTIAPEAANTLPVDWASAAADPKAPARVWHAMLRGRLRVEGHFYDDQWMALGLIAAEAPVLSQRRQTILSQGFAAHAQKVIGLEQGIAPSTVTGVMRQALSGLGLTCIPSRVPLPLSIAAGAGLEAADVPDARFAQRVVDGALHATLVLPDPKAWLEEHLSSSEALVTRLRLHGNSLEAIALLRGRSARTVANQLASAYRKLRVGGRSQLVMRLTAQYLDGKVPLPRATSAPASDTLRRSGVFETWANDAQYLLDAEGRSAIRARAY